MKTLKLKKLNRVNLLLLSAALLVVVLAGAMATRGSWTKLQSKAAFLLKAQTAVMFQTAPVNATFSVRSYGGKCLEFGVPRTIIGQTAPQSYPVFISDCKGTAAQQVRIEELTDRPEHLVILRAGSGVIGKKLTPVLTQRAVSEAQGDSSSTEQASPAALIFTSAPDQIPLEVQPYTGSEWQIFALDGDSIILAEDRNLVVEVQNNRGANGTPLVLGRRDLDDSEFWTFTATDGSAKRPTSGFVRVPHETNPIAQNLAFLKAVDQSYGNPGTVIEVDPDVSIDLTGRSILIPAGITIRGDRRGTRLGPELSVQPGYPGIMLLIDGDDVRITGLRLRGPTRSTDEDGSEARGILARDDLYLRSIIDHNEMSDWPEVAVAVKGGDPSEVCNPRDHRDPRSRPQNVRVARNFLHHNRKQGGGYGVGSSEGAFPLIEGNTFVSNRHAIAGGDGGAYTGYRAWYNLVLSDAPEQRKYGYGWYTQDFDMHGTDDKGVGGGFGGTGGQYVEIARNTFLGTNRANFDLRGEPCYLAEFHHNVSLQSYDEVKRNGAALDCSYCGGGDAKFKIYGNQFSAFNPTIPGTSSGARFGVGDFDGDGKDDVFLSTGAAWYYAPEGTAEWRFLNAQTDGIGSLLFGDFDGDKRTDVFTQHGNNWDVSWGGASKWETINGSGPALSDFAIGDFNGDRRADVFYANGREWFISFGGVGLFTHFALAIHRVSDLRFGDFNGDGKTDVFGVVGEYWKVVYGGTNYWAPLRPKLSGYVPGLTVADFNGDGRADVATRILSKVSWGGTGDWATLHTASLGLTFVAAIGRFDDNAGADVLLWRGNSLDISSGGTGTSVPQSRQDMR